jgi:hypothetical protein
VFVKVPNNPLYTLSSFDVDKNKMYKLKSHSEEFNYSKVETTIQNLIQKIKIVKFGRYDESMLILNECLKCVKGVVNNYNVSEDYTIFSFPRSPIQPYFSTESSISLKHLLNVASKISHPQIKNTREMIMGFIYNV